MDEIFNLINVVLYQMLKNQGGGMGAQYARPLQYTLVETTYIKISHSKNSMVGRFKSFNFSTAFSIIYKYNMPTID